MTYSQCSCRACGVGRGGLMVSVWAFLLRWIQIQVAATPWVDWALVTSGIGIIPLSGYSRSYSFITGRNSFSCQTYTISMLDKPELSCSIEIRELLPQIMKDINWIRRNHYDLFIISEKMCAQSYYQVRMRFLLTLKTLDGESFFLLECLE